MRKHITENDINALLDLLQNKEKVNVKAPELRDWCLKLQKVVNSKNKSRHPAEKMLEKSIIALVERQHKSKTSEKREAAVQRFARQLQELLIAGRPRPKRKFDGIGHQPAAKRKKKETTMPSVGVKHNRDGKITRLGHQLDGWLQTFKQFQQSTIVSKHHILRKNAKFGISLCQILRESCTYAESQDPNNTNIRVPSQRVQMIVEKEHQRVDMELKRLRRNESILQREFKLLKLHPIPKTETERRKAYKMIIQRESKESRAKVSAEFRSIFEFSDKGIPTKELKVVEDNDLLQKLMPFNPKIVLGDFYSESNWNVSKYSED